MKHLQSNDPTKEQLAAIIESLDICFLCEEAISQDCHVGVFTPYAEHKDAFFTPKGKKREFMYKVCNGCFTDDCADIAERKIIAHFKKQN